MGATVYWDCGCSFCKTTGERYYCPECEAEEKAAPAAPPPARERGIPHAGRERVVEAVKGLRDCHHEVVVANHLGKAISAVRDMGLFIDDVEAALTALAPAPDGATATVPFKEIAEAIMGHDDPRMQTDMVVCTLREHGVHVDGDWWSDVESKGVRVEGGESCE